MSERWVVNASPVILLAKIGHAHLLAQLTDTVVNPRAVVDEVYAGPETDPARIFIESAALSVVDTVLDPMIIAWDLGSGETAVLSHVASHPDYVAVIDDGAARRCARALAIPVVGTLGVILRARQAGLISAAVPLLHALKENGIRLNDEVIRSALSSITGEHWV